MPKKDQGSVEERYKVIPRSLIFIQRKNNVLLIKGAPTKRLWANLYNGIGGHIERGEDPLSSAMREIYEETGLSDIELEFCGNIIINVNAETGIMIFVFRGKYKNGNLEPSHEGVLEWVDQNDIYKLPLVEDLPILLPRVLTRKKNEKAFFATYSYDDSDNLVIKFN